MPDLQFRPTTECAYDLVALGEVMLRLDPGVDRIRSAHEFRVSEGGGEYNVARALSSTFGLRSAIVTSLVDNEIGHLTEGLIRHGGVDVSFCRWLPFDGVGRVARNPLNFVERGFGVRAALGVSDRGHSATGLLRPGEVDWEHIFGALGVRCLHTGGIFAAISDTTAAVAEEAMRAARRHGTKVSYDLNYRPSLWRDRGGERAAAELNRRLLPLVDILIGLPARTTADAVEIQPSAAIDDMVVAYPNISCMATTRRSVHSASRNDWSGLAWTRSAGTVESREWQGVEIFDRVGGGDGFAAGLLYGLLEGRDLRFAVEYGVAHGALVMTTPGDTSIVSVDEVRDLVDERSDTFRR